MNVLYTWWMNKQSLRTFCCTTGLVGSVGMYKGSCTLGSIGSTKVGKGIVDGKELDTSSDTSVKLF